MEKIGDYDLYTKSGEDTATTLVDDYTIAVGPVETLRKVLSATTTRRFPRARCGLGRRR